MESEIDGAAIERLALASQTGDAVSLDLPGRTLTFQVWTTPIFSEEALSSQPHILPLEAQVLDDAATILRLTIDLQLHTITGLVEDAAGLFFIEPTPFGTHAYYGSEDRFDGSEPQSEPSATEAPSQGAAYSPAPEDNRTRRERARDYINGYLHDEPVQEFLDGFAVPFNETSPPEQYRPLPFGRPMQPLPENPRTPSVALSGENGTEEESASEGATTAALAAGGPTPAVCPAGGCTTKTSLWLAVYYDNNNPTAIINNLDPYMQAEGLRFFVNTLTKIPFITGKSTHCTGTEQSTWLLPWFRTTYPSLGTSDKAVLFASGNGGIDESGGAIGCAGVGGTHLWVLNRLGLSDDTYTTMHEMGHSLGDGGDDTLYYPTYYGTALAGCSNGAHTHYYMSVTTHSSLVPCWATKILAYYSTSDSRIASGIAALPRYVTWYPGVSTDGGHTNFQLRSFTVIYDKVLQAGDTIKLTRVHGTTTVATFTADFFYAGRKCSASTCAASGTNVDFDKYRRYTIGPSAFSWTNDYVLPSGAGPSNWEIWPSLCHLHSGVCHYGPHPWRSMVFAVN